MMPSLSPEIVECRRQEKVTRSYIKRQRWLEEDGSSPDRLPVDPASGTANLQGSVLFHAPAYQNIGLLQPSRARLVKLGAISTQYRSVAKA